ncbi:uncharacterized protein KZ484_021833 [Pholidichthys leucotaenia]
MSSTHSDLPQRCICENNCSLDQKELEPPVIKEEPEEHHIIVPKEECLLLKQEADRFMMDEEQLLPHSSGTFMRVDSRTKELFGDIRTVIVQYDEEDTMECEHRLSDVNQGLEIKVDRRERPHPHVCEEYQEMNSSLEPEPPETEVQGPCRSEEREGFLLTEASEKLVMRVSNKKQPNNSLLPHPSLLSEGREDVHSELTTSHSLGGPYTCTICGEKYNELRYLLVHVSNHAADEPFPCSICKKTFKFASALKKHMKTHTGEKPFSCEICRKCFSEHSNLKIHMRSHTGEKPYSCEICEKNFCHSGHLLRHMRTHTGERPFSCEVCGKSFGESGHLKVHMRIHTGEKPFSCDICGSQFAQSSSLLSHKRSHKVGHFFVECGKS